MIEGAAPRMAPAGLSEIGPFLDIMRLSWQVAPRQYVVSALEDGYLSPSAFRGLLSNYFYIHAAASYSDVIWQSRAQLSPVWGVYEIGVLSPILRIFFPPISFFATMNNELIKTGIYGFFPTAWGAAILDFGAWGAAIYVRCWGFSSRSAYCGSKRSALVTPPLMLTFIIASIRY